MAYDAAARTLYGESARLNLPNSVGETPSPKKPSESIVAESPVCYSDGVGCIEGDWADLFVKLPKAEDLALQAFDTFPPLLEGAGFLGGDLDGELTNFEAWCS